jgi:hypothetical protein
MPREILTSAVVPKVVGGAASEKATIAASGIDGEAKRVKGSSSLRQNGGIGVRRIESAVSDERLIRLLGHPCS